jgi:hypothetical protein
MAVRASLLVFLVFSLGCGPKAEVHGPLRVWQTLTLDFHGPATSETAADPNPFLDYRLQVLFTSPSGRAYDVPGFFDGDGGGGTAGDVWRVRFTPDEPGAWTWAASFCAGPAVAVELSCEAAQPAAFDGARGEVNIEPSAHDAPGFAALGRLEYAGGHYLEFVDGPYWIRGGADSPENFLAYAGFDNTRPSHDYAAHLEDWREGDPDWGGGKGKAIIGAVNHLAAKHVNSAYMLLMNIGGDGGDVWPWTGEPAAKGGPADDNLHFDISKLAQWETVFAHAQAKGVFLHLVLNEAERENKQELDDGELGVERKLYYRELIARFSHHLAMQWNLCEEYNLQFDFGPDRIRDFARYVGAVDPYDHPVTVHSAGDPVEKLRFIYGDPLFSLTSIQLNQRRADLVAEAIREATAAAGRPLPVSLDEFTVDVGQPQSHIPFDRADLHRKQKLWPTYFSGGMIELILEGLLDVNSFKGPARDELWDAVWYARKFMEENLPFHEMEPADDLVAGEAELEVGMGKGQTSLMGAQVFAKRKEIYAVYFPIASSTGSIDLSDAPEAMQLRWYNPRTGEFEGETRSVEGGTKVAVGPPPSDSGEDWTALIQRDKRD